MLTAVAVGLVAVGLLAPSTASANAPTAVSQVAPSVAARVVGGTPINITESPWQAMIVVNRALCGGSIVMLDWIVTAAHCVLGHPNDRVEVYTGITTLGERGPANASAVASITTHPGFDMNTFANDIALIRLATPIVPSIYRQPIALPIGVDPSAWPPAGTAAAVSGWGTTQPGTSSSSDVLRRAGVQVLANPGGPCVAYAATPPGTVCAGLPAGGVDTCQGDSGGPLVVGLNNANTLAGVTSSGDGCASKDFPGIYTSTAYFLPWIAQYIPLPSAPTAPASPAAMTALARAHGAIVTTWQSPADFGGSPITGYTASAAPSDAALPTLTCATAGELTCTIRSAAPGVRYAVSVVATNAIGSGPASAAVEVLAVNATRKPGASISAARLRTIAGMNRPVKRIVVPQASRRICAARGTTLTLIRAGNCTAHLFDARGDRSTIFVGVAPRT